MKIGFIGAGKVGVTLGKFLHEGGAEVTGFFSRTPACAEAAAAFTNTVSYDKLETLVEDSDAIFLTVPDGQIAAVARQLPADQISDKCICHCSGALSAREAFPDLAEKGACGYAIHPLFPISDPYTAYQDIGDAFFCLEGPARHWESLASLFRSLGCRVRAIRAADKARYHAACVIASNFVCALVQDSVTLLEDCGFGASEARAALAPLMRANLEHLLADGPEQALTGPVERNDVGTVRRHLSLLTDPAQAARYRLLSLALMELAARRHPTRDYAPLAQLLREERMAAI